MASANDRAVLRVAGLRKTFKSVTAVEDLTVRIDEGEVLGLLGPNGAGKTTTIRCVTGLLVPDEGRVEICGVDARSNAAEASRRLAVVTQAIAVYPSLDVATNLRFYGSLAGLSGPALERAVGEAAATFGLVPLLGKPVTTLSIGQQRLVHVATAFVSLVERPSLLVLDEATAGLDVTAREVVLAAVRDVAAKGIGVLYSSHYLGEVEELCKRVAILHRGRVIADGEVAHLVKAHGGGHVELELDDGIVVREGDDLGSALATLKSLARLRSARVVRPSLDTVFRSLTGEALENGRAG